MLIVVVVVFLAWKLSSPPPRFGENVTVSGTLDCAACKLMGGPERKCSKYCCQRCIKGGAAALLEDGAGNLYLLIGQDEEKPVITAADLDLFGEGVTVKGILAEKGGVRGIYVQSINGN